MGDVDVLVIRADGWLSSTYLPFTASFGNKANVIESPLTMHAESESGVNVIIVTTV
jgi:hypothetical protein